MPFFPRCFLTSLMILFFSMVTSLMASQSLFVYRDFANKGDENQVLGVITAFNNAKVEFDISHFNIGEEEKLQSAIKANLKESQKRPILLAVGEKTVDAYAKMLPLDGVLTVHLCHMLTANHGELIDKVDYLVLPSHGTLELKKSLEGTGTKLIETIGVSHNRRASEIKNVYGELAESLPSADRYYGVLLSGDAPTPSKEIKLFTAENAKALAQYLASIPGDVHLLITNGPRTGKHDENSIENKSAHRDGQRDFVTKAFLDELMKLNVKGDRITLFDFQFNKPSPKDMDLILGAVDATDGLMFVPGESTSAISESIDVLPQGSVVVYDTTSMNPVHKAHVQSELKAGRIKHLPLSDEGYVEPAEEALESNDSKTLSAAETIVLELMKEI